MSDKSGEAVENFIEKMGLIQQNEGLPRIAGRIMGFLVIYGGPFSFQELSEKLQVSRASISTNTRILENMGVLERITKPGERQDFFKLRSKPYYELLKASIDRFEQAKAVLRETNAQLPKDWQGAKDRLEELENFYNSLTERSLLMIKDASTLNGENE